MARKADARVPWFPRGTPIRNSRHVSLVAADELAAAVHARYSVDPADLAACTVYIGKTPLRRTPS